MTSGTRLALVNVGTLVTGPAGKGPVRRPTVDDLGLRTGVGLGIEDGRVALIAPDRQLRDWCSGGEVLDCGGRLVTPGLVDCHTHAVFGRPRVEDHSRRARGETYQAIAAAGGGILSTVRDFRGRGEEELAELSRSRLALLAALGSTTIEVKSGYGLSLEDELKALRVMKHLAGELPLTLVPTFLGAHEVPGEYRRRRDEYVRLVIEEMLPRVAAGGAAEFCDVFCEPGVFSVEEAEAILRAAQSRGLGAKLHADELEGSGGAELAARLGAVSADHLGAVSSAGVEALAASDTVAVLLPGTLFFLGRPRQAPARALVDAGAIVALATDFNPGSSPTGNLPLVMAVAVSQARLLPAEAFVAATVNAAAALRRADQRGRLAVGARADLVVWNCRDVRELAYWYGMPLVWRVYGEGVPCYGMEAGVFSAACGGILSPPNSWSGTNFA
jgi:imidazolonepropionase